MAPAWRATFDEVRPDVAAALAGEREDKEFLAALLRSADDLEGAQQAGVYAAILDVWLEGDRQRFKWARKAADRLSKCVKRVRTLDPGDFLPYLIAVFEHTGYLKDYKAAYRLARRADPTALEVVDAVVRRELPDIWIKNALKRGDVEEAIDCWYEQEDHRRARQCADELVQAAGDRVDILVSARLSQANYHIGRGARRHYRRACKVLSRLRLELEHLGEVEYWPIALDDIKSQHGHRPALLDEMSKARLG